MDAIKSQSAPPPRKRRWLQFSLRSLMLFVLCCSLACSWFAARAAKQREAVRALRSIDGCYVRYDCDIAQFDPDTNDVTPAPQQTWVESMLDSDFIHRALSAQVPVTRLTEAAPHLARLPHLETVVIAKKPGEDDRAAVEKLQRDLPDVGVCVVEFDSTPDAAEDAAFIAVNAEGLRIGDFYWTRDTTEVAAMAASWVGLFIAFRGT